MRAQPGTAGVTLRGDAGGGEQRLLHLSDVPPQTHVARPPLPVLGRQKQARVRHAPHPAPRPRDPPSVTPMSRPASDASDAAGCRGPGRDSRGKQRGPRAERLRRRLANAPGGA